MYRKIFEENLTKAALDDEEIVAMKMSCLYKIDNVRRSDLNTE